MPQARNPSGVAMRLGRESMLRRPEREMIARANPPSSYAQDRRETSSAARVIPSGCKFSENARTSRRSGEERRRASSPPFPLSPSPLFHPFPTPSLRLNSPPRSLTPHTPQNNGRWAHQEVDHVHFHLIPKPVADKSAGLGIDWPAQKVRCCFFPPPLLRGRGSGLMMWVVLWVDEYG